MYMLLSWWRQSSIALFCSTSSSQAPEGNPSSGWSLEGTLMMSRKQTTAHSHQGAEGGESPESSWGCQGICGTSWHQQPLCMAKHNLCGELHHYSNTD